MTSVALKFGVVVVVQVIVKVVGSDVFSCFTRVSGECEASGLYQVWKDTLLKVGPSIATTLMSEIDLKFSNEADYQACVVCKLAKCIYGFFSNFLLVKGFISVIGVFLVFEGVLKIDGLVSLDWLSNTGWNF